MKQEISPNDLHLYPPGTVFFSYKLAEHPLVLVSNLAQVWVWIKCGARAGWVSECNRERAYVWVGGKKNESVERAGWEAAVEIAALDPLTAAAAGRLIWSVCC